MRSISLPVTSPVQLTTVPARVVVVGAGNTAIDAAIAAVRLGADRGAYCVPARSGADVGVCVRI